MPHLCRGCHQPVGPRKYRWCSERCRLSVVGPAHKSPNSELCQSRAVIKQLTAALVQIRTCQEHHCRLCLACLNATAVIE